MEASYLRLSYNEHPKALPKPMCSTSLLLACLAEKINADGVEPLAEGIVAWYKELSPAGHSTCVFRNSAFANDVAKTNMTTILQQHGIANVLSLLGDQRCKSQELG